MGGWSPLPTAHYVHVAVTGDHRMPCFPLSFCLCCCSLRGVRVAFVGAAFGVRFSSHQIMACESLWLRSDAYRASFFPIGGNGACQASFPFAVQLAL